MTLCEALSDRMPAVASGRTEWTAEERGHLASCRECAAEWELVNAVTHLGRDMVVDAEALTPVVLKRVGAAKAEERRSKWVRQAVAVGALAAAAVLLVLRMPEDTPDPLLPRVEVPGKLQLAELDDAAPAELEMVLTQFEEPASPENSFDGPDLEGLDMSQVESALRSWEES